MRKISLEANIEGGKVDTGNLQKINAGDTGISLSRLNPIGKVMVNDVEVEGKSFNGELIDEETEIEVVKVNTYNVIVKRR